MIFFLNIQYITDKQETTIINDISWICESLTFDLYIGNGCSPWSPRNFSEDKSEWEKKHLLFLEKKRTKS